MGKIEVRGNASRIVYYDFMKIIVGFHAKAAMPAEASEHVMRECEEFLGIMKNAGCDISGISLRKDLVEQSSHYCNGNEAVEYNALRSLEIASKFDMGMINDIRAITQKMGSQVEFRVNYELSNEDAIRQKLMMEAMRDAKRQAEAMAKAIGQKIAGLIFADKNSRNGTLESEEGGQALLCCAKFLCEDADNYEYSDELSASYITLTEYINTAWETA